MVEQDRVEDDPFWREHLAEIDYKTAGEKIPGDVVRKLFGGVWRAGADPNTLEITVGKTGVPHLDLAQVMVLSLCPVAFMRCVSLTLRCHLAWRTLLSSVMRPAVPACVHA
jgi:hypothetical protein